MASTIKVDNVQNQPGTNIIDKCGTTITLGQSGDTIALACGASQTGFGRTGTVDWVTTIKVTGDSPITAVSGKGYFLDTTAGTITINLPTSPSAGDIVSIKDYARTWASNAVTVGRGGSNMDGVAANTDFATDGLSLTFIYMDGTKGWSLINDDTTQVMGATFIAATGGTTPAGVIVCTNYKVHTFTGPGTFCVSAVGNPAGSDTVDYMVVAGGAAGGSGAQVVGDYEGGGGGAGGFRESPGAASGCYSVSPRGVGPAVALPVSVTCYAITVGGAGAVAGAPFNYNPGGAGSNSVFSTITSQGGGGGGSRNTPSAPPFAYGGQTGGSGGGAGQADNPTNMGYFGAGNTPSSPTVAQGTPGGGGLAPTTPGSSGGGGGGGATVAGTQASDPPNTGGNGGTGATTSISGCATAYAGGGGGAGYNCAGTGGTGGGGTGLKYPNVAGTAGTTNTGGGGGGGGSGQCGGPSPGHAKAGGSGIVIIRYKFQ